MTPFEQKYSVAYRKAFEFHRRCHGTTDLAAMTKEANDLFKDQFEIDLFLAIYR